MSENTENTFDTSVASCAEEDPSQLKTPQRSKLKACAAIELTNQKEIGESYPDGGLRTHRLQARPSFSGEARISRTLRDMAIRGYGTLALH